MVQRLDVWMRARVEVLLQQGLSDAEIGKCLGRNCVTVWWEKKRCAQGVCRAETAQAVADSKALRPRLCKLAVDGEFAQQVADRLKERLSLHAVSAELRCLGYRICAETIYQACYDVSNRSGLLPKCWVLLPCARRRRKPLVKAQFEPPKVLLPCARRRRKPHSRCSQAKRSVLGDWRRICDRPSEADNRQEPGH